MLGRICSSMWSVCVAPSSRYCRWTAVQDVAYQHRRMLARTVTLQACLVVLPSAGWRQQKKHTVSWVVPGWKYYRTVHLKSSF